MDDIMGTKYTLNALRMRVGKIGMSLQIEGTCNRKA
jgi:hypothetical protein